MAGERTIDTGTPESDSADPQVARIVALDSEGNIELEVLPGSVKSHADLLSPA